MISINLITPQEMQIQIAQKMRRLRLELNLSQHSFAQKSGVSYGTLKKFEQTGQISLASLLKLVLILGRLDDFKNILMPISSTQAVSLDELIEDEIRKRGRK